MIIRGKDLQESGHVQQTAWEGQFQPAGVDLSVQSIHQYTDAGVVDGDNSRRRISSVQKLEIDANSGVKLMPGAYKIVFNEIVSIPADAAAICASRSTLLRCGAAMHTAVWDPGYTGRSEALMVVSNPHGLVLHRNAKVAQLVFIRLEKAAQRLYSGKYQNENLSARSGE